MWAVFRHKIYDIALQSSAVLYFSNSIKCRDNYHYIL